MNGTCGEGPLYRWETVSGQLLTDVKKIHRPNSVPTSTEAPPGFNKRFTSNFASSNKFSTHDNRNRTQDYGHYFGGGLGRKLFPSIDAHQSQTDPAFWYSTPIGRRESVDTTQRRSYKGGVDKSIRDSKSDSRPWTTANNTITAGVITQNGRDLSSKCNRRFPRNHHTPPEGLKELDTHIAYANAPHKTFLQTLCSTQEPFLKHNSWKYSYFGVKI
ncbi:uncharacterized protein LOC142336095 isoform X2 [Convolutriloba macropyga]